MTLEELRQYILGALDKAIGIRDEQRMMANTAKRVGGDLVDIVEILRTLFSDYLDQALRTFDDVEFQKLVLRESFKTADFIPGVLGAGTGMVGTEDFTTGKLTVRNYMEVMALAIAQVFWRGGQDVYSPSGMKVNKVEEYDDYWRCYMETSKGQKNTCTVGAQMRCNKYGDGKKKYYWNLVTSTGENYIDLSKTDRDGVDVPEVGDELAQFGHRTDPNLSWILVISSMSEDAGMTMYAGVDSYTLSGKWAIRVGKALDGGNRVGIFTKNGEFSDVIEGLEDKVGNIQIGGANLINQFNADGTTAWFPSDSTAKVSVNNRVIRGEYVGIADAHYPRVCNKSVRKIVLDLDSEYTVSFKIRSNKLAEVAYGISDSNSSNRVMPQVHSPVLSENFIEVRNTFKPLKQISSGNIFYIYITLDFGVGKTAWIEVKDVKIEKGNKATDFSYSQSDNEVRAQAIAKAEAELAETKANAYADGIVTEAEQNAINEAQARLDALKFGTVNLISRKMMLGWNEKNKDIAVWGQDADGVYLKWNLSAMAGVGLAESAMANINNGQDIFIGSYKPNTQYVISIDCKNSENRSGATLYVIYTDGTRSAISMSGSNTKKRVDLITDNNKTIQKIVCYINSYNNVLVYSLGLFEGNKPLPEIPVATEDLTGQSNVNLVDGGKELTVTAGANSTHAYKELAVPKLKPNTVYHISFKTKNLLGSPTVYTSYLYKKNHSGGYVSLHSASGGIMITPNDFTETEAKLLLYAGRSGSTNGNSVKFSEVMLVEGFTPPSSYSPSPGDVAKDIKDVSEAVANLNTTITGAFKDGIIDEAEAKAIASNINILNAEKADIDAYYNKLYANAYLTGTAKTNLASAKTAYNTAHANLISSINTAIADGKATAAEKADVNAKFTAYNTALSTYKTRVGEADKAIQDRIKELAEQDATNKVDGIQIGVRNLFLNSGTEVKNGSYNIVNYVTSSDLVTGGKYTLVLRGTTTGGQQLGMWANSGNGKIVLLKANMNDEVVFAHVTLPTINESYKRKIDFYNYPSSGATANPATIKWACLYEGHIKPPMDWVQAPEDMEQAIQGVQDDIDAANAMLADIANDNKLTPSEKQETKKEWDIIVSEKATIVAQAATYSVSSTAYTNAYNALNTYITPLLANLTVTSDIVGTTFRSKFKAYYDAKINLLKAVTDAAKQFTRDEVSNIQVGGTNLFPISKLNPVSYRTGSSKEGSGSEIIFKCNTPQAWAILPVSIPTPLVPANTNFIISMDIRNTNGFGFEVTGTSGTPTKISIKYFENTTSTWKRISYLYNSGSMVDIGGINLKGVGDVRHIKIEVGNKPTDWSPSPEDVDQSIQDAIAKTVDITAPSQVFKYGAGYTGTPTPASIVLTAIPRNFTPTSYQWQYLNGSTWTNISGATSSTYTVSPGNTTFFPSGTNVRSFRCICNGDEKLSDSFTLAKLADGATGADGKGVSSTVVTYQSFASGTTAPTGTWSSTIPAVPAGQFLWTRTVINYTSGSPSTLYSVSKIGTNGTNGNNGVGVSSTVITYQASTSGTTAPTGTWSGTIPSVPAGQYLWTKTVINYTSGSPSTIYSVGKIGDTGAAGKDAYTVLLTNEAQTVACDANGNPLSGEIARATTKVNVYRGTTKLTGVSTTGDLGAGKFSIGTKQETGGTFAWNGVDGVKCTTMTADTASCTFRVYLESASVYIEKTFVVTKAKTGATGADGKGVSSTVIAYQASTSGTTAPTGTWSSTIPAVPAGQFLWTRTVINYTSGSPSTLYSVSKIGTNGTNGNNGVGVSSTVITYQASTSGTTAPTGTWSGTIPSVPAGQYLWTKTVINYTSGSPSTIYSVGKIGEQGIPGESINGKMLYKDPEFKLGLNSVVKYSNSAADIKAKLTVERIAKPSDAPTQSGYCLRVTCKATQSPGYGGVVQSIQSRANAVFIQKIIAKIPVGYNINVASNSMGTGYTDTWLTSTAGTGKYTTYLRKVICGATGTFSSGGHVYITGSPAPTESAPLEWYISSMTCYDQTADGYADVEITTKDSFAAQLGFTNFEALKANAVTKGPLVKAGMINTALLTADALIAVDGFVDKLKTNILKANSISANMLAVAGFSFQDYKVIGGKDFGVGPGVKITSTDAEKSFKAYKDASHYVEMFYRSASDWGLKGVDGEPIFQLGSVNKIGLFNFNNTNLVNNNGDYEMLINSDKVQFSYKKNQSDGYFICVGKYMANTLLYVQSGDIWHQGDINGRACVFYTSDVEVRGRLNIRNNAYLMFENGSYEKAVPVAWAYTNNGTIPTSGKRLMYVYNNNGSDNPCYLSTSGANDGQVITIINTSTSHRINIKGTAKGDHWILEGCCGTFRYLSGYGKWYPERFSW